MTSSEVITWALIKNSTYVLAYFITIQYLGFNPETLAIYSVLMVLDVFTGVVRSAMVKGWTSVKSSLGIRGMLKKILVLTGIFSVALTAKGVGFDITMFVQSTLNVFILAEAYSILGNIHSAITKKPKSEFDAVTYLLNKVEVALKAAMK